MAIYVKIPKKRWTDDEIRLLSEGGQPEGRSVGTCRLKARELGFAWHPEPLDIPRWTRKEDSMLRKGKMPPGRSQSSCLSRGWIIGAEIAAYGDGICTKDTKRAIREKNELKMEEKVIRLRRKGMKYRDISKKTGINRSMLSRISRKYRERTGEKM